MARGGDTYSSVIAWLKILLPMVALGLLSTLFLLSRSTDRTAELPFSEGGPAGEEQVAAPYYAGTTPRGDSVTARATRARPMGAAEGDLEAEQFSAIMDMADGSRITLESATATLNEAARSALLRGRVRITSSTGYVIETEAMRTAIDGIEAETLAPVSGSGPAGSFTAGKLRILPAAEGEDVQLLFTEGVNLIYDPKHQ